MMLKKITLKNIRSYKDQEIDFSCGSTLLAGDIGSGKTSILLAIEFALFGLQPGQKGAALLRNGESEARVIMEFEVEGRQVIIERTLKRGKTISQDYCSITIDGEKKELSVTELKNKVLELLNYPKEFSKKQNILYKFTVYTPQEEMKQIILQDSVTRINTLRHVFGIDKYKKILENVSILASKLREEKRIKEALISHLEQDKTSIITKEEELETKQYNLVSIEKELFLKTDSRKKIQEEKQEIFQKIEEKNKLQQEIEKTKIIIGNKNESVLINTKTIEQLQRQIKELEDLKFDEANITQLEQEILSLKQNKQRLNENNLDITSKIASLSMKNQENENIKNNLAKMEICPTCLQDVDPVYKSNVANKMDSNTSENTNNIESLSLEKKKLITKIMENESKISLKDRELQDLRILKMKFQGIAEKQTRVKEIKSSNELLKKDIGLLTPHIETLRNSVFALAKFDNIFELKNKELEEALNQEKTAEIKVVELRKEIEVFSNQIEELKERIKQTQEIQSQHDYITELETWLSKKFAPLMSFVEKNVMTKLKIEFSRLFMEWFCMLVSDSFNVRLSDDFTPIIEHQDYEIDYAHLSGGERTAVALAYRLALNQVINSIMSKIKTRDIVILDEPTEGFSDQQLDKMREVLDQLDVKQLIIVSHEQKIESFVENVMRFRKDNNISGMV